MPMPPKVAAQRPEGVSISVNTDLLFFPCRWYVDLRLCLRRIPTYPFFNSTADITGGYEMKKVVGFSKVVVLALLLTACGSSNRSEETAKIEAVEQLAKEDKISLSEMLQRKRAIYRANSGLDEYQEAYFQKAILYAQRLEAGAISFDEFMLLEADAKQDMELRQDVNCMKVRQENRDNDRSGLASTNGFVAIVSMGGLIADSASESRACR
jgi:hypothetical protein